MHSLIIWTKNILVKVLRFNSLENVKDLSKDRPMALRKNLMRQQIATVAEWAWSNRLIDSKEKLRVFAYIIYKRLKEINPNYCSNPKRAVKEIEKDMITCVLKLSYGGRQPSEISESRKAKLTEESHQFFLKSA